MTELIDLIKFIIEKGFNYSGEIQMAVIFALCFCFYMWLKTREALNVFSLRMILIIKNRSLKIRRILIERRLKADFARASYFRMHNGTKDALGEHLLKYSCVHEIVELGASSEYKNLQNVDIALISPWLGRFERQEAVFDDIDDYITEKDENGDENKHFAPSFYYHLKEQGIKMICAAPIISQKRLEGFLVLSYNEYKSHIDRECVKEALERDALAIKEILDRR